MFSLGYVEAQFRCIEENLDILDKKNAKYTAAAQSRLMFIMNESKDIEAQNNRITQKYCRN